MYDGSSPAQGAEYTATFNNCSGTCDKTTGKVTINNWQNTSHVASHASVKISALYNGETYTKTVNLDWNVYVFKLAFNQSVINLDNRQSLVGRVYVDDVLRQTLDNDLFVRYSIDEKNPIVVTYSNGSFTIPTTSVTKNVTVELVYTDSDGKETVFDREVIGCVKNGENAAYYQIDANHR
jgi:hypothetical protein